MPRETYAIDIRETVEINGAGQSLRIRGASAENPVVLFLHGGPGVADRHWVLKNQSRLASACTLACWDQRGAGLGYDAKRARTEKLSLDLMVEDAQGVVDYLRKKFKKDKVLVVGHSWGSILGVLLAQKYPEGIAAYVGMGQFANGPDNERISYEFVVDEANKRGNKKALKDLQRIGAPVGGRYKSMQDMMVQRDYMTKFGGGDYKGSSSIWSSMIFPLLRSPEYGLLKLARYAKGAFYSLEQLWDEVVAQDFIASVTELKMPVYLTEGRHDKNTPVELSLKWFDALKAPAKKWIWFEESAHSPIKEEPERWGEEMRKIIRETVKNTNGL